MLSHLRGGEIMLVWFIIIVSVLVAFLFGSFLMKRVDDFLDENRKYMARRDESSTPDFVVLSDDVSEKEVMDEVERFRKDKKKDRIVFTKTHSFHGA